MNKTVAEVIREKGYCLLDPKGTSMYPLLRDDCGKVFIVAPEKPLKKYDIALYVRADGSYILHRVMDVTPDGYVMCGDNQWRLEYGVTHDMVIGRLDSWYKGKKRRSVTDKGYLRYTRFWCKSLKRRKRILPVMWKLRKLKGHLLRK